ncbi:DNA polymerase III subunit epsilon [Shinella zoogloeoides]|uniref:DNA polymerase III subunit epsilon n=1 Tax=Shinella zoogloeoides TaxID=352475 RepID=UPI00299EB5A6|nr:DNA polymerase III subunit epsilon [Shinella zoogloeoides]WPE19869.1 hypothetical protein ShzoTeo12_10450 [Shinella zoogloeoides]
MRSVIRVIDLETGPDPLGAEPGIVEYGHTDVWTDQHDMLGNPFDWRVGQMPDDSTTTLVKPYGPIPPETSGIHNITNGDVASAPSWEKVAPFVTFVNSPFKKIVALAAHNIEAEKTLIGRAAGDLPWICTYKVALRLWPEAASHSNNAIRYYLDPDGLDPAQACPVHRALPDSYITAFTLREALNAGHSFETLIKWTNEPALLPRCKIGKWRDYGGKGKGTPWSEVDSGFLSWILTKDFDENTMHTASFHLAQREIDQRNAWELDELNRQYRKNGMPETERFEKPDEEKPFTDFSHTKSDQREHPKPTACADTQELPL